MPARNGAWNKISLGRSRRIPADGAQVGGQDLWVVGRALAYARPAIVVEHLRGDLSVPKNLKRLALRVIGDAGQSYGI